MSGFCVLIFPLIEFLRLLIYLKKKFDETAIFF